MVDLASLNPQQRLAVQTIRGPILILAGAGTGKTRVITHRAAHMVDRGVLPEHILAVTFTNKAAREMRERVAKLIPKSPSTRRSAPGAGSTISTFHSLCVRILRQHIDRLGYKRNFVIYDETEQLSAVKKILRHISANGEKCDPLAVLSLLSRLKTSGLTNAMGTDESVAAMAQHIQARYQSALRANNAVDFDDLLILALELLEKHPDVLSACRDKYQYIMVDEYQDTSAAQFRLVQLLAEQHRNLCVVGDDDQSIYGWRGAEISNLLDLEKYFPELQVIKLEQNYRSTTTILAAANALIKNNLRRRSKQLWSRLGQGSKILLQAPKDDEEEARLVVEQIEFDRLAGNRPWSDNAILFRTNVQSRVLETALRKAAVRYHLIGGQSFFDRREIKDFMAYLKFLLNPDDDISLLRIANVPPRGLGDGTMEKLIGMSHEFHLSVFATMQRAEKTDRFTGKTAECVRSFVGFAERTRQKLLSTPGLSLTAWSESFLKETGYFEDLQRSEKTPEAGESRVRSLREIIASLDSTSDQSGTAEERLEVFLEEIALNNDREEEKELTGNAVTLITIHSCKGLEFPRVYIVGLEDGLLPHSRSKGGVLDEERRLFYVALTRAKERLTLSHCAAHKKYGQLIPCHPSPFLKELPPDLLEPFEESAKTPVSVSAGKSLFSAVRASVG